MGKGNRIFARKPSSETSWREIAAFSDEELQSVTTYVVSPAGDKVILISPVKPPLHLVIRDSIQSGRGALALISGLKDLTPEQIRQSYDISRGELNRIVAEQKTRGASDAAGLEAFVTRLVGPPKAQ
jgi:hypothetical protein